jgi:hypothetical protein
VRLARGGWRTSSGWRRSAAVATLLALCGGAVAVEAQAVRLELNRSEMTMEEQALVSVTVEGAGGTVPQLPPLSAFTVVHNSTQDQFSMVNGSFSRRVVYQWVLQPKETGEFEIGPASIDVDGARYQSATAKLKVLPASAQPRSSRPVFVTASVTDTEPFVGEQVLFVWRFYRRARIADPRLESLDLGGFLVEDLGAMDTFTVTEGGMQYEVSEIRKALFSQRAGAVTIPPSRLVLQLVQPAQQRRRGLDPLDGPSSPFDEFFGRMRTETVTLATEAITVTARPLPPAPDGFSGLVGEYRVSSSLSATRVAVGESLTQKIVVSGSGNLNLMGDLPLDELAGFKVYGDQPKVEITRSKNGMGGTKTFSRALVPLAAGSTEVPETRLVFFDPSQETYRTVVTPAVALDVAPSAGNEELNLTESLSPGGGKVAVRILADDLLPIRGGAELVAGRMPAALLALLVVAPPIAFVSLLVARRRADRFASDVGLRRRRGALRTAVAAIGKRGELESRDASSVLRRYIGDRVGAEGQALTSRECAERLSARGASDALVGDVHSMLERFEAADFGGGRATPVAASELLGVLERLERELRRGR